jgi:Beta-lactamase
MVLEQVTRRMLPELLRGEIIEPLGLVHTSLTPPDADAPEMREYEMSPTDGSLVDVTDDLTWVGNGGSGGTISTGDELLQIFMGPRDRRSSRWSCSPCCSAPCSMASRRAHSLAVTASEQATSTTRRSIEQIAPARSNRVAWASSIRKARRAATNE